MSSVKRLTERVTAPFTGCRVDRAAGTISGVLICGTKSANGRDYPVEVLRRDCMKYEGRPVNADHAREATVDRRLGWFAGVTPGADGRPRGTLHLLKSHPLYERVMEAAERNPRLYGFSHVAMCKTKPGANGREVVESIESVESVDLVAEPATTTSLFEGKTVPFTRKQLVEWLAKHPKSTTKQLVAVKRLGEMDGAGGMDAPAMDAPPAEDADPADGVSAAFKAAIMSVVDSAMSGDTDPKEALAKIKKLLTSHGELNDDGTVDTDDDPKTGAADEGKRNKGEAILEAIDACAAAGFAGYTREDLEIVAAAPADRRQKVAERLKGAGGIGSNGSGPTSTGKSRIDPSLTAKTKQTTEADCPKDGKSFAESIR